MNLEYTTTVTNTFYLTRQWNRIMSCPCRGSDVWQRLHKCHLAIGFSKHGMSFKVILKSGACFDQRFFRATDHNDSTRILSSK
jgi:hypothetical protein